MTHGRVAPDLLSLQVVPFPDFVPIPLDYELPSAQLSRHNLHCEDLGEFSHELELNLWIHINPYIPYITCLKYGFL